MARSLISVSSPEELGLSGQAMKLFLDQQAGLGIHSLALVRGGKVFAFSYAPWSIQSPHTLFSLSKSYCSMAAGIAVAEGLISYEDSLAEVLKDSLPAAYDPNIRQIQLKHLLSMSSGLAPESDERKHRSSRDWARTALSSQVIHRPGTVFHYNTIGTYLAGRMVSAASGQHLRDYLMPRLFEPLGIQKPQWDCCPLGYNMGGTGLHLNLLDLAATAQLLLSSGRQSGQQLLPLEYLDLATHVQVDNLDLKDPNPHPDWQSGYGFQFWISRKGRYRGDGMYGQVMMIDLQNDLALCCTAGLNLMGDQMDAIHHLMDGLLSLPPQDQGHQEALRRQVKGLAAPLPEDAGELMDLEGTYWSKDNIFLRLETPDQNTLRLFYREGEEGLPFRLSFHRDGAFAGQFVSFSGGERPQAYLGSFGVKGGVLKAQALMPQAPYTARFAIKKGGKGLLVQADLVGGQGGQFECIKASF